MPAIHLLVAAAGVGSRFGGDRPKQYQPFGDSSLMDHTLGQLLQLDTGGPVWLGLAQDDRWWPRSRWQGSSQVCVFAGGSSRLQTVAAGLQQLAGDASDWVLIHDVVRPCISRASLAPLFAAMQTAAQQNLAGIAPGEPVHQAVKRVDETGLVREIVSREGLWQTQTPQAFRLDALNRSVSHCLAQGIEVDDEMAALHLMGYATALVPGLPFNIKVTRPQDMQRAWRYWQLMQEKDQWSCQE